jgi:dienelactone hydrolase
VNVLRWIEPVTERGVTERRFHLVRDVGVVPGILWLPARPERPLPLVLMGHGGSGHKRSDRQLRLGRWFAGVSQVAAVAIDGPYHGDRVAEPVDSRQYQDRMAAIGVDTVTDGMVDDWCATLDAISELDAINADRVAYLGFSMGTRFGLPFVAAAGRRLRCAVLGKYGMRQPSAMPAAVNMAARFSRDAPRITVPVLFHVQWDDELFFRVGQFELFELLGSRDKQLIAFSGAHRTAAPAAIKAWREFVRHHLEMDGGHSTDATNR